MREYIQDKYGKTGESWKEDAKPNDTKDIRRPLYCSSEGELSLLAMKNN